MLKKSGTSLMDVSAILLCLLFAIGGILINLNRFWQYESGYYDFGMFDVPIWKIAHFQLPIIDHFIVSGKLNLADHFNPSIYLFAPIYWFTSKSEALFFIQDIAVGLSGYVIYSIGKYLLKNKFIPLAVLMSYFLFTGLQNAVWFDFHELTVMTFFLSLTFWAIIKSDKKLFILFFIVTLLFKETLFLLGIGLSFFIFFYRKKWRKLAIITLICSIFWGWFSIKVLIPYLSGGIYVYSPKIPLNIFLIIKSLFSPFIKIKTVFQTFLSFLFLPIFTPASWLIFILNFSSRFLSEGAVRWDMGLHYSAEIAPTLAVSSLLGLKFIKEKFGKKPVYVLSLLMIVNSLFLYRFVFHGPYGLAYNRAFYGHTKDFRYLDELIARIPKNASVLAQNNLASRFLHQQVWILRENYKTHRADYIIFDLRPGQNPVNFLGIENSEKLLEDIKKNKNYEMIYHEKEQYIFKRK